MSNYRNDRSTCTFYTKIGACRHGEKCSRTHIKPISLYTLLLPNLYQNPKLNKNEGEQVSQKQLQENFDHFYKDVFLRFASIGDIDALVVCENENDHLNGNVYVKFTSKDTAYNGCLELNQTWFGGRPVHSELSPVESFHDANCRAHETGSCNRGDHCNFMHIRKPSHSVRTSLFRSLEKRKLTRELQELRAQTEVKEAEEPAKSGGDDVAASTDASKDAVQPTTSVAAIAALFG